MKYYNVEWTRIISQKVYTTVLAENEQDAIKAIKLGQYSLEKANDGDIEDEYNFKASLD